MARTKFVLMLQELGENISARLSYGQGTLEVMVSLPEHERPKELISDIVKTLLKATSRRYEPFGSTTFKQEGTTGGGTRCLLRNNTDRNR